MRDQALVEATRYSRLQQIVTFIAVIVPLLSVITVGVLSWGWGVTWVELLMLGIMYAICAMGVTVGFHRLFTHRAFETFRPIKVALAILGSMAVEGPLFDWVANHRRHHRHSDQPHDPHSPHGHGEGIRGVFLGWWHAHLGWMFERARPDLRRYTMDLRKDRMLRLVSRTFPVWVLMGMLLPAAAGGWITGSWRGVLLGFLWGGLVRTFLVHHVTWSINSVCHLWGYRTFTTSDESRNNMIFGLLGFGEGWHNNHHAFPTSARHGLRWWEFDLSYLLIRLMRRTGLAWRVQLPTPAAMIAKRR